MLKTLKLLFDTVVLCNFIQAEAFDWLIDRYKGRLCLTEDVCDELASGVTREAPGLANFDIERFYVNANVIAMSKQDRTAFRLLRQRLGKGEASAVAVASNIGAVVVTDDRAARNECKERGILFTGTIGILKAAVIDESLSLQEAETLHYNMVEKGFYSPIKRLADIL